VRQPAGLSPHQRYLFDLRGYLVLDRVLPASQVERLNEIIDAQPMAPAGASIESQRFGHQFLTWDPALRALLNHADLLPLLKDLLGDGFRLDHSYGIVMAPGTAGLDLHGGGTPFDPAQYYLHRDGRLRTGLTTVMWSLVDSRPGDGGFCCVPGSHKSNEPLPRGVSVSRPDPDFVREVPLSRGSAVIFTEALTHGTLPWTAPWLRRLLVFKYSPSNSAWGEAMVPDAALWACLDDQQRRLCEPPHLYPRSAI
jgi:hypothetical protein